MDTSNKMNNKYALEVDRLRKIFENYKYHTFVDDKELMLTLPTKYAKDAEINFYNANDINVVSSIIKTKSYG